MPPRPAPRGRRDEVDKHSYDGDDGDGCCGVGNCLASLISLPVIIAASIIVPVFAITFIIMGAIYINDCAIEPLVPIWLIVQGVIMLFGIGTGGLAKKMLKGSSSSSSSSFLFKIIGFALSLFTIAWFIAGNVWVYNAWAQSPDYAHYWFENGCNMSMYRLAFWGIIVLDALFAVAFVVGIVAFLLRGCKGR
ncbi:uncharacterized protein LOC127006363 [Eriocheir sinensis]|uniref:uncharacterized protein LOC127006363 n=1 Tax=Eriocheir sinensis TaxID=95602 RepID=UPI0021CA5A31|nr:uncharacterized protein LOC127006363 [Eriocheir sinensis]XP_050732195.1 uncharacterized protein LOC127006363 [Eriocheir sinensis]XP_050732196.1 uncharacterized protein LOC127006363 [Eriocheir sinensis]XP_050732197.1 uncharacterized protein LOC127006363 [Eriocheir sinensis]XP_050732198.1 uncharacterized protein LOC127006363 [Eriocheir sinensis]XP_050732199.1 uncharacterized protein LOC127006363 [Eriocheir sinensis]XP_050732200.1 uncharacterized protein LOC127006363 [Eriocheir sinensis]XP_0